MLVFLLRAELIPDPQDVLRVRITNFEISGIISATRKSNRNNRHVRYKIISPSTRPSGIYRRCVTNAAAHEQHQLPHDSLVARLEGPDPDDRQSAFAPQVRGLIEEIRLVHWVHSPRPTAESLSQSTRERAASSNLENCCERMPLTAPPSS